jgi:hypothetical protein
MKWKAQKKTALVNLIKIETEASKMIEAHGRKKAIEYAIAKMNCWREFVSKSLPCAFTYANEQMVYWRDVINYLQTYNPKQHK